MITPEEIDAHQFATTRFKEGYDPDEVDHFLDRVIADYRYALAQLGIYQAQVKTLTAAPTTQIPTVYSDMDKLLAVAQETADRQIANANGQAGSILAEATKQAASIVQQGHDERHNIIGKLEVQRTELEQTVVTLSSSRDALAVKLRQTLAGLEES